MIMCNHRHASRIITGDHFGYFWSNEWLNHKDKNFVSHTAFFMFDTYIKSDRCSTQFFSAHLSWSTSKGFSAPFLCFLGCPCLHRCTLKNKSLNQWGDFLFTVLHCPCWLDEKSFLNKDASCSVNEFLFIEQGLYIAAPWIGNFLIDSVIFYWECEAASET